MSLALGLGCDSDESVRRTGGGLSVGIGFISPHRGFGINISLVQKGLEKYA